MSLFPVVLSGGSGTRLWPVSRELHPKPFMKLPDGESLLQKAYKRAMNLPDVSLVTTVTNRDLFFKTKDEYRESAARVPDSAFILEPVGRNTAGAIAVAAQWIMQAHGPDAILLILAADHLIAHEDTFAKAVAQAVKLARAGGLVTFGVKPTRPETGYGYIEADGHSVRRFVEKPDLAKAQEYLASGRFLWNSGMFCFGAGALLQQLREHAPEVYESATACLAASKTMSSPGVQQIELDRPGFSAVPSVSIDVALMERSKLVAVVPADLGWSDVGSWTALSELTPPDAAGNRIEGEVLLHEASNCFVRSEDRVVAMVGVDDLIVVDTVDALLVASRAHAQNVKAIVDQLKKRGNETYRLHREVHRPWGTYTVLEEGNRFKIKRIVVRPAASLSLQMHHHRNEHWIVVSGMARVVNGESEMFVNTNESTYIPAGHKHRLENPGMIDLVMIEVQSGEYLGEDDIVRLQDNYGRVGA